jgi:hypothetical protein
MLETNKGANPQIYITGAMKLLRNPELVTKDSLAGFISDAVVLFNLQIMPVLAKSSY